MNQVQNDPLSVLSDDIVCQASEALLLRDDISRLGMESREIDMICDDLGTAIKTIQSIGLRAYFYLMDNKDTLAARFDIEPYKKGLSKDALAELEAIHISAAEEGLREYIARFIEMIKTIYEKLKAWANTILSYRDLYLNKFKDNIDSLSALDGTTPVTGVMSKTTAFSLLDTIEDLHKQVEGFATPNSNNPSFQCNADMVSLLTRLGLTFNVGENSGSFYISSGDQTVPELYPTLGDTTLAGAQWTVQSAKDFVRRLVNLGSVSKFKTLVSKAEKMVGVMLDESIKLSKENGGSDKDAASLVRTSGSMTRMLSRLVTEEHADVMYCCRTARNLVLKGLTTFPKK